MQNNPRYQQMLDLLISNALQEDIGEGDLSTLCAIPENAMGKAVLKLKQSGILAGMQVAEAIFKKMEPGITFTPLKNDGDRILPGQQAFEVTGKVHTLLSGERLVLNCMQRMSGIASLTHTYVEQLDGLNTRLLDTRKTTPNFRLLEKEAVRIGGGQNHRFGLYDMIMLKDNHIDYCGGIEPAILKAYHFVQQKHPGIGIEVETRSLADVEEVMRVGKVSRIMFDNFNVEETRQAVKMVNSRFETESSGGIHLGNLREYASTGVDFISSGAIIHQAVSLDMSLKAVIQ